jgi:hypothetical protein
MSHQAQRWANTLRDAVAMILDRRVLFVYMRVRVIFP